MFTLLLLFVAVFVAYGATLGVLDASDNGDGAGTVACGLVLAFAGVVALVVVPALHNVA